MSFSAEHLPSVQHQSLARSSTAQDSSPEEPPRHPSAEYPSRTVVDKILPAAVLLVALSISYYYLITLPHQERTRTVLQALALARVERRIEELKQRTEQAQRQQAAEAIRLAKNKEALFNTCLLTARQHYEETWADQCQSVAALLTARLQDCSATASKKRCNQLWGAIDSSASCALSAVIAGPLNESYAKAKDECFKRYPQGEALGFSDHWAIVSP